MHTALAAVTVITAITAATTTAIASTTAVTPTATTTTTTTAITTTTTTTTVAAFTTDHTPAATVMLVELCGPTVRGWPSQQHKIRGRHYGWCEGHVRIQRDPCDPTSHLKPKINKTRRTVQPPRCAVIIFNSRSRV